MKKYIWGLILGFILVGCTSSGGYTVTKAVGDVQLPERIAMSYDNFDGTKVGDIYPVAEGEQVFFEVMVDTLSGALSIYVRPEGDEETVIYQAVNIPTSSFTFTIDQAGMYVLYLEAQDHRGGYTITNVRSMKP